MYAAMPKGITIASSKLTLFLLHRRRKHGAPISAFPFIALKPITSNAFCIFAFYASVRRTRGKYPTLAGVSNFCFVPSQASVWTSRELVSNHTESSYAKILGKMKAFVFEMGFWEAAVVNKTIAD